MAKAKPYAISKQVVWDAYKKVKANRGAAGVDGQSLAAFETDLKNNLYKLWNRMSSGSYFPPPVRLVEIPKGNTGQTRPLGIPTVSDRIAQMVVKMVFEPHVEPHFHEDSYGYRPGKSALDAVGVTRQRCWRRNWVIDLDIKGFFDNLDWDLVMRAVRHHTDVPWILLYVERWLRAPVQHEDGRLEERTKGSPQGSVISPLLSNLFMHYAFDEWLRRNVPDIQFARYADDAVVHARSHSQAEQLLATIRERLAECGLELHPEKTKIVYCKDDDRRGAYEQTSFDFLGYTFRPRRAKNRWGKLFISFLPWGTLEILEGVEVEFIDGNPNNGAAAIYVDVLDIKDRALIDPENRIALPFFGNADIYYNASLPENDYLGGLTYVFADGAGTLIAQVPEPATIWMIVGVLPLVWLAIRRRPIKPRVL